jgi:uncharacterized phage-associated protein
MVTVLDVAELIVGLMPSTRHDPMKLQKLIYYAQAWSLVWDEAPLFADPIEAWKYGPVSPRLYGKQRHEDCHFAGSPDSLRPEAIDTINAVLAAFGDRPAVWLSELAHREQPWMTARQGLPSSAKGNVVISHSAMRDWYAQCQLPRKLFSPAYMRGLDILVDTPQDEVALLYGTPLAAEHYVEWLGRGDEWAENY